MILPTAGFIARVPGRGKYAKREAATLTEARDWVRAQ
jgi:hypothetical protein